VVLSGASASPAQVPEPELVRASAEFIATEGCGSRADLLARITRRSERIRFEPNPSPPRRLRVEIVQREDQFLATLELEQPSGRLSSRTLRAASCDEALEALALVAALSLDPTASTAPEVDLPAAPDPPPPATPPPASPATAPAAVRADQDPSEGDKTTTVAFSAAALGQLSFGPAPGPLPGVGFAVGVEFETGSAFSPVVRMSYLHSRRGGFTPQTGVGEAAFELNQGVVEVCPVRLGSRSAAVYPCPFFSGGRLLAEGSDALAAETHSRPWWVVGGGVLALFHPLGPLELALAGSVGIPLIRDTFQFAPDAPGHVVHAVPGAAWSFGLGAGAVFP
jgi:hypothetical protein